MAESVCVINIFLEHVLSVRSQWVRISAHPRVDPGELGWLAMEEARYGLYQYDVGRSGVETARLFERQDPLHPAIAFGTGRAQRTLAPQHPKAQRPLRTVICRLDPALHQKYPERVHLPQQPTRKAPRIIRAIMILLNQLAQSG